MQWNGKVIISDKRANKTRSGPIGVNELVIHVLMAILNVATQSDDLSY